MTQRTAPEIEKRIAELYNSGFGGRVKIAKKLGMPLSTVINICGRLELRGRYKAGAPLGNKNNRHNCIVALVAGLSVVSAAQADTRTWTLSIYEVGTHRLVSTIPHRYVSEERCLRDAEVPIWPGVTYAICR